MNHLMNSDKPISKVFVHFIDIVNSLTSLGENIQPSRMGKESA